MKNIISKSLYEAQSYLDFYFLPKIFLIISKGSGASEISFEEGAWSSSLILKYLMTKILRIVLFRRCSVSTFQPKTFYLNVWRIKIYRKKIL